MEKSVVLDFNFDDLDQLGPQFRSLVRAGREKVFLENLCGYIAQQDQEIERLCLSHYQEFIQSVDQLLKVREDTVELRNKVHQISQRLHDAGQNVLDRKKQKMSVRKNMLNLEKTMEAVNSCMVVLSIVQQVNSLFGYRKYYAALRCIDAVRSKMQAIKQYEFATKLELALPEIQETIQNAVLVELREWFVFVRENSRKVGEAILMDIGERAKMQNNSRASMASIQVDFDKNNVFDPFNNFNVTLDFKPLYQAIHIYSFLDKLPELVLKFEEDRGGQANLFLTPSFQILESIEPLERYLQDVTGFFIIENHIFKTTSNFRSRASVDFLWETANSKIYELIERSIMDSKDPTIYILIKKTIFRFAQALQVHNYGYSLAKIMDLLSTVFERYCDLMKTCCSVKFIKCLEEEGTVICEAKDHEQLIDLKQYVVFKVGKLQFPKKLPFTKIVPFVCQTIIEFASEFYEFASEFHVHYSAPDIDYILKQSIDNVLITYISRPLLSEAENQSDLPRVLQIFADTDYFIQVCLIIQERLEQRRITSSSGKIVLYACEDFKRNLKLIERKIFDLLHLEIDSCIQKAEYDLQSKLPSLFLRNLINFLTTIMYSTMERVSEEVKGYMYFEIFDRLANQLTKSLLKLKKITPEFLEQFVMDYEFLEKYVLGLENQNLTDTLLELKQTISLLLSETPMEFLEPQIYNKRYNRIPKKTALELFERVLNATSIFSKDKKRKSYEQIITSLKLLP